MSWRTAKSVLFLRNLGRSMGVNRVIASLLAGKNYEDRFQAAMLGAIRSGDVVWDVVANVGLYSKQFADITGSSGKVIAFEPSPTNLKRLGDAVAALDNVRVMPVGLGEKEAVMVFQQGDDDLGATSRIVGKVDGATGKQVSIQVRCGDELVRLGQVPTPNVVKIDTEGFELDVLLGMHNTLRDKALRVLCIEMHFGLLQERGLSNAASDIEGLLTSAGYSIAWPDASHVVATRRS